MRGWFVTGRRYFATCKYVFYNYYSEGICMHICTLIYSVTRYFILYIQSVGDNFYFNISQMFSIVIAAYISELTFTSTYPTTPLRTPSASSVCYDNPAAAQSGHRICLNGVAASVSSILVCMMLLTFDAFIPCLNKMVSLSICV